MSNNTLKAKVSVLNMDEGLTIEQFKDEIVSNYTDIQSEFIEAKQKGMVEIHIMIPESLIASFGKQAIEDVVGNAEKSLENESVLLVSRFVAVAAPLNFAELSEYSANAQTRLLQRFEQGLAASRENNTSDKNLH